MKKINTTKIVIIGGGFTGTTLALNFYRLTKKPLEIYLFDKRGIFGVGDAYSTPYEFHLLNVRASDMSAFSDDPNHFVNWLKSKPELLKKLHQETPLEDQFVPRLFYGMYLQDLLKSMQQDKQSKINLHLISAEVTQATVIGDQVKVIASHQPAITVDTVVLALGNNPASQFPFPISNNVHCIDNPWDFKAPTHIAKNQSVLIVGTGLSMIDAVLTLHHQQHAGPIYALSRRGLIPLPHAKHKTMHHLKSEDIPDTLRATLRFIRSRALEHRKMGGDWRDIIDAFRHHIANAWARASLADKKRFIRHVLPIWNVHRHRVHIEIADLLERLMSEGQLQILSGRVLYVEDNHAHIKIKNKKEIKQYQIDWLINCMGPQLSMKQQPSLLRSLQEQNIAHFDHLNLGLLTNQHGALQINSGEYSKMFYTLGALTKGMHWEITAVPDIRKQCLALARHLLER